MTDDNTRPVSVAELLARNGTIGSPPVSGHRRRKRRNAVSVAELTGEIPVLREEDLEAAQYSEPESTESGVVDAPTSADDASAEESVDYSDYHDYTPTYVEAETEYVETQFVETQGGETGSTETETEYVEYTDVQYETDAGGEVSQTVTEEADEVAEDAVAPTVVKRPAGTRLNWARPPRSSIPLPRRQRGPERSHDPRPRRRSSQAERMAPDPVDESVDLAELVAEQAPDPEELRSYLRSSSGTLFSGETIADDLARRGDVTDSDEYVEYDEADLDDVDWEDDQEAAETATAPRRGALRVLGTSLVAVLQSLLAVVFGAGLFIAFDQLWRWNNILALALSALVIAALMIGVHAVRKTEDFVSILIAALVGILVTFGPLALQST